MYIYIYTYIYICTYYSGRDEAPSRDGKTIQGCPYSGPPAGPTCDPVPDGYVLRSCLFLHIMRCVCIVINWETSKSTKRKRGGWYGMVLRGGARYPSTNDRKVDFWHLSLRCPQGKQKQTTNEKKTKGHKIELRRRCVRKVSPLELASTTWEFSRRICVWGRYPCRTIVRGLHPSRLRSVLTNSSQTVS